jgi:hypothetical protein
LLGYEFVFGDDHTYYAFGEKNDLVHNKRYWMRHGVSIDSSGRLAYITQNLLFTCRWLGDYYKAELVPRRVDIVNCSGGNILDGIPTRNLERAMKHAPNRKITPEERARVLMDTAKIKAIPASQTAAQELKDTLGGTPYVAEIAIKYYEPEVIQWLDKITA